MGKKAKARAREREAARALAGPEALAARAQPEPESEPEPEPGPGPDIDPSQLATRLSSAAIHLLRRLQWQDASHGVSAARLSALSVLVLGGSQTLGALAATEGVRPPSMTRLINAMEADGLVERTRSTEDGRLTIIRATDAGQQLFHEGRGQRVAVLAAWLGDAPPGALRTIDGATEHLEAILREHRDR